MPVGAAVSAVGAVAGAGIGALGAKSAAKTQANAANKATDLQLQMYGQTREDLAPFRNYGAGALPGLSALLGFGGPGAGTIGAAPTGTGTDAFGGLGAGGLDYAAYGAANPDLQNEWARIVSTGNAGAFGNDPNNYYAWHWDTHGQNEVGVPGSMRVAPTQIGAPTGTTQQTAGNGAPVMDIQSFLESLPGYKFARDQGIKSITNALGSRGTTGAQAKGIARFVTGLADQTYGSQVDRLNAAATLGENAAAQTGSLGVQTGANAGANIVGAGQAAASGTVGATNAITGGISNLTNAYLTNRLLNGGIYSGGGGGGASGGASDLQGFY